MRIYLSVDMEGLAGVAHPAQVVFGLNGIDRTDYDRSRGLMAGETNAAIEGAFEHGAREVIVNDSHWQMRNLRAEDLAGGARLIIGDKPFSMTQGIGGIGDGAFDGAAFIGYHAGAGHPTGVIAHTYSSATVLEIRINGVPHNEAGLNAIRLGYHGVPVILVAGDDALATEIAALLPWAERVVVKRGLGRTWPTPSRRQQLRRRSARAWAARWPASGRCASTSPIRRWMVRSTSAPRSWPITGACCPGPRGSDPGRSASEPITATACTGPASG